MNVITAIGDEKLNILLRKEEKINVIGYDIQYQEGIFEILETNKNINYLILNINLIGNLNFEYLIEKIKEKNNNIIFIIFLEKENEKIKSYLLKNNIKYILNKNEFNLENILNILKNKNINLINEKNIYKKNNKIKNINKLLYAFKKILKNKNSKKNKNNKKNIFNFKIIKIIINKIKNIFIKKNNSKINIKIKIIINNKKNKTKINKKINYIKYENKILDKNNLINELLKIIKEEL